MDTLTERTLYPCEPASEVNFRIAVSSTALGFSTSAETLRRIIYPLTEAQIPWHSVGCLYILGAGNGSCNERLKDAALCKGAYIDHYGTQLLLIHPEESELRHYFECCGNRLKTLNIFRLSTQLPSLDSLAQLTALNLSFCDSLTHLPSLDSLSQLTTLNLSGCRSLAQLPCLDSLAQLTTLKLSECTSLAQLPCLDSLSQLTTLDLSGCENLTQLPSLDSLSQLTALSLSRCRSLTQLPSLDYLSLLTTLNLYGCENLTRLPDSLRHIRSLRMLELGFMHLQELPDWLPEIAEGFSLDVLSPVGKGKAIVNLCRTTIKAIPDMSIFLQPYDVVCKWFEERRLGRAQTLNEIKVVFLGDGEAGKSHTIARLMNDGGTPVDYMDQSTPGIVIKHKPYTLDGRDFRVHYWDFGGQEIMHSMHRIFLTSRTMYVVLLNARDDTQGDRAQYWLHNIQSFAPGAPVLLVLNKIDQNPKASVDERTLRARYPGLTQIVRLSARDFDRERFNREFTDILLSEIAKTGYLDAQWPSSWIQVKDRLENMKSHFILGDEYRRICRECQLDTVEMSMLKWFNDLGVSFCFCDEEDYELEDHVILRPDWITNGLYIILFNRLEHARNGLIPHKSIYHLLKSAHGNPEIRCTLPNASYNNSDIHYVLGVMRKFALSFTDGKNNEFIPMLCQRKSTVDIADFEKDTETLEFSMEFEYLPENLLHRLMVERHEELDMKNAWRRGAKFSIEKLGYSAVVIIDGNALRFFIRHTDPMHRPNTYLTMLKANVDRIVEKMGLKAPTTQLVYKLDGKRDVFDYEMLKLRLEVGQTHELSAAHRRMIPIADILNQSAPDGLEDEMRLLKAIRRSCFRLQDEPGYGLDPNGSNRGKEDLRNRRIRSDLELLGYHVSDQTQRGGGELDFYILDEQKNPWTIIEALRISGGTKREWNEHLEKLAGRYNTNGVSVLYLLTYVDADTETFDRIWQGYRQHIPTKNAGSYTCVRGSLVDLTDDGCQYIQTVKCRYECGSLATTVYHIFVRIEPKQ